MKLSDLVSFHLVKFMYKFHSNLLPVAFDQFYIPFHEASNYSTRLAVKQSYYLPKTRTNYGISSLYVCMAIKHIIVLFVETPRKFITVIN